VFEESNASIEFDRAQRTRAACALQFEAIEDTGFIIGSAVKRPCNLVLGAYSVHASRHALGRGEARIAEIGKRYPFLRS
jgi:hypothetical protein